MRNLKYSTLFLLIHLAVFFNIERLDLGQENLIDIQTFVYILATTAFVSMILSQRFLNLPVGIWLGWWLGVYFAYRISFGQGQPLMGGLLTYLTITELTFITLTVILTFQVTSGLLQFELAVEDLTLTEQGTRVLNMTDADTLVAVEFARGRRHHRPISVVVIEPKPEALEETRTAMIRELQNAMMNRYIVNNLARKLNASLRRSDLVMEHPSKNRLVIMSPETSLDGVYELMGRIRSVAQGQIGLDIACGAASFPHEAVTFVELLHQAEARLSERERKATHPVEKV